MRTGNYDLSRAGLPMTAKSFLRLEMLPALNGDCLWLEWGRGKDVRRMLVDGGPIGAWPALEARMARLPEGDRFFELMMVSHVDTDHIDGLLRLLAPRPERWNFALGQFWFNGWRQMQALAEPVTLGGKQGEFISALLAARLPQGAWNKAFKGMAVVVPDTGALPVLTLAGGLKLTLLSPTPAKLATMQKAWRKDLGDALAPGDLEAAWKLLAGQKKYLPDDGLVLGTTPELQARLEKQSRPDNSAANGSSIAVLAEFGRKRILLLADAHADAVCASLKRLLRQRRRDVLQVDAVKLAHHGSAANLDDELLALVASPRWLVSSNGAIFHHPDAEAIERVIARSRHQPPTLYFNYLSEQTRRWQAPAEQQRLGYRAVFRDEAPALAPLVLAL